MSSVTDEPNAPGLVEQARSELGQATSATGEKVEELKQQGRGKLGELLDDRTSQAGSRSRQVAHALRHTVSQLDSQGDARGRQLSPMLDEVADRLEQLGSYLEATRGDDLLHDAETAARRRPWMVAGLGVIIGLAASRVMKASAERRYGVRYGDRWPDSGVSSDPYRSEYRAAPNAGQLSRAR
jgi:ElaB/YqjD/DUF883 family membrane-anchored ribosome-binding protein